MRFEDDAVFEGAFYSLPCMFWQNSDGSVTFGLWLSNGQGGTKWCDSIDLNLSDSQVGTIADVNIPVQTAVSGQTSSFLQYSIPALPGCCVDITTSTAREDYNMRTLPLPRPPPSVRR